MVMQEIPTNECRKAVLPILLAKGVDQKRAVDIELCVGEAAINSYLHGGDSTVELGVEVDGEKVLVQVNSESQKAHFRQIDKALNQRKRKKVKPDCSGWGTSLSQGLAIICYCSDSVTISEDGGLLMVFSKN